MSALITGVQSLRDCRTRNRAFYTRARRASGLLLAALLAALPMQAMAQTPGVSISATPDQGVQYVSITEGGDVTFTVSRIGDNSNALTVNYSITDGGGPANLLPERTGEGDYTSIPASHTFPAESSASHEFTVTAVDDEVYEPNQYFTLTVSGSYRDEGGMTKSFSVEKIVRIRENDERYLTLSPVSDSALGSHPEFMAKEGGTGIENQLKISLNETLPYVLSISYTVGDDPYTTATSANDKDFMMKSGTARIPADSKSVTIDISIADDNLVEPTEYFTLEFGTPDKTDDGHNALGTFKRVNFQESKLSTQPLSVSIMDNDTASTGGVVYLRGEGPSGPGVIDKYPSTRRTLTEGQSTIITAEIAGAAPSSAIEIPLKFDYYPNGEATEDDYSIPTSITIPAGQNSAGVTLTIRNDTDDERYRELLVVEIDDAMNFPADYTKGDRSRYEVIMLDNDKTGAKLQGLSPSTGALSEASGKRQATFQIEMDRLPKKDTPAGAPFSGVTVAEGDPTFKLEYSGAAKKATRNDDYMSPIDVQGNNCSTTGGKLTCTVTFTAKDDKLYEGGSGTTEKVAIRLRGADWKDSDGIENTGPNLSLTIEDNDKQPMLSIGDVTANEGGKLAFEVKRAGAMENKLSVRAATGSRDGENSATANSDYATRSETLEFAKNIKEQTFEVTTTQDVIDEMDETFLVKLSMAKDTGGEPEPGIEDDTAIGTITDDDDAPTELTISVDTDTGTDGNQDTIAEAATTTTVSVTATIDSPTRFDTDQTVTVTVGNPDNAGEASEGEGGDYETVDEFTITIPATEASGNDTFELTPLNDRIDEDGEKISVEGELTGTTVTPAAITIVDDDTRGITVSKTTLTIDEADDTSTEAKENEDTYEVVLKSEPTGTVTVDITNPGPTVATVDPSSLTFTATNWDKAQTVTVIAKDDTIDDAGDQKTTTISHTVSAADTDYKDETAEDVAVTVLDDDETPMALTITVDTDTDTADNQSKISEGADKPTVRITATLDGETQFATAKTITITVGDSGDTAIEGTNGDYDTVDNFDISLPAGAESVSHNLTLTLNDDTVDELDEETVTVTGELAGVTVKGTTFTIEDNDATPTVTLVLTPASINESGATNASTVTATMDGTSSEAVTLTVSTTPVSPAVAGDLTLSDNKTLTIPANTQASTGVVTITAVDNDVDAANKTVTVAATATGGNALVQAPGSQTLTITDDDTRGITVSKATLTLDEEDNTGTMEAVEHQDTYTVVLDSEPSGGTVTIGVASGDTTIAGVAPATLTFTASDWSVARTVTVTAVPDGIDNPNDRRTASIAHTVTATGTDYDGVTASGVTVTVNDDDGAPTLSINSPSVTEVDSDATSTLTFTVQLLPQSGNTVTVNYADTGSGTATSGGTDYDTLAGGTLTFAPGETSKPVPVTVNGDNIDELDETVVVQLSSPSNATLTGGATTLDGTGTINDNDSAPTVSVADAAAVSEGNVATPNPANNMTFTVTLSAVSGLDVTVPYTLSGTATAGIDYTELDPRSVTIIAGTMQANIAIPVAGDEVDEENETITVTLGTPTNATVSTAEGAGAASGTITDDDTRGVSVTPTALTVAEADKASTADDKEDQETYKVVLTSQPTGAVTVNLKSGDESVARINTASLVFDADNWNTEHMVTVTGQADVIDNTGDERTTTIAHTVSAAGTDYASETAESVAVTVTDDDAAPSGITLTANPDSVTENGGAKTITVTAAVNGETRYADARTVSVSVGGGTAISGTDYTAVESFDITIGAGEDDASNTFTLTPENDVLAEGSETIDVTGTLSGITITPDEITLTDDDAAPSGITLSVDTNGAEDGTPDTVAEDAGATVVTVTATVNGETRYVDAKTVAVSVADNTAASPADYAAVNNFNITIAAGAASHTGSFTVTPVDDDLDESNETIDVTGTLTDITINGATVTLTDNDDPVSFSIADAEATEGGKVTFTVSRAGAGDNVASVKIATATDSGDDVNAADADDYTAIATAQTVNFAKGVATQTVEVQTTQDDLFEPDETFLVNLSEPALADGDPGTGVSIESGKGTAIGTIKNDDTEPSFAVADASASEGDAITFTVTRSGAMDNAVSVKWNTKADSSDGANAALATDYTPVAAATTLTFAKGVGSQTFTVATTEDNLDEDDETFLVELTEPAGGTIATAEATGTINDDDAAPSGITLSVDTNGSTSGTPSTVAEDAGATVVTVTATVNGTTRYVDTKTVAVSVADGTAASPADYAAVSGFNITIAAGAASHTGSFTVTPVDDDLDESNETIDVTGTLSSVTITGATVTFTDNDDPVSFSIADAEATEGGKVTFTVSRKGAGDNVASVKIATATDSGDGIEAADADDYTAIATAQTVNFAKGVATQTVEVQTTQDDLFEPDETFLVNLSEPALADGDPGTGVSIESGKGTATGTIKNDDTQPSFAVANASASEGDAITFTVTRSGAMDNAVSVKWNTKADSSDGANAASATDDYTPVPTATTLTFAKGVGTQTFTVATTEDVLDEGDETFLVELTGAEGGTITTAQATGTINDDDAAPTGITLSVDTNGTEDGAQSTVAEGDGATVVTVTATVNGTTRYVDAKTVAVSVADGTAASPADYAAVNNFNITIAAGAASHTGSFSVTPVDDDLDESNETIDVTGTLSSVTITGATVTFTDNDDPVSISIADAEATEGGKVVFTVSRAGAEDNVASVKIATAADSGDDVNAAGTSDYTAIATAQTLNFAKGVTSQMVEVQTTQDDLFEPDETFKAVLSEPALGDGDPGTGVSIVDGKGTAIGTIKNDDFQPSFAVADASASEGDAITFTVTRSGAMDNVVSVKWNTKAATGAGAASTTDYTEMTTATKLDFAKGVGTQTFTVATTEDVLHEGNETFLVELTGAVGGTISTAEATGTINDDDAAPSGITLSVDTNGAEDGTPSTVAEDAGATVVTVTATVNGETRYVDAKTVAVSVADGTAASPADYAAVNNFNITIAAGAASHTGSFTVTPVDDDLDESNETIDVTGTLSSVTITGATVTLTDNDDPVSFSIADAEATEGGKVTFTVSRKGAGDNVASVKIATATDSGDGVNASDADDYTAIATAQTLNFAKGVTSQMVEVQTTQDDLFEPDETFRAVLSEPALGQNDPGTGVSIESGKGTATGTIKNDDTMPSFAVADASASEGDAITFTVTRSGAKDNAVSVKWNTKAATGAGTASTTDYTPVTTAQTLSFAKGVSSQTFTVATTVDVLAEGDETFLVELTGAVGGTISTAEATGTINDDDAAPSGITLSVDTNGAEDGTPSTVAEDAGATVVTVTATVNGETRYVDAKTVAVSVADGTAASPADYAAVNNFNITIAAGAASHTGSFTVTPVDDDLDESNETIDVTGTLSSVTVTAATVTLTDNDDPVSFSIADAEATEGGKVTFTVNRAGAEDNVASVKIATAADSGDGVNAASTSDYTAIATAQTLNFAKGVTIQTVEVQTAQDDLFEPDETFLVNLSAPALADGDPGTGVSIESGKGTATGTIRNDDTQPSFAVADASASEGDAITFTVTRSGAMDNAVSVKWNTKAATGAGAASTTDYTEMTTATKLDFAKGVGTQTFTVATTEDVLHEGNETFLVELTEPAGGTIATAEATGTINDDDAAPTGITLTVSPATVGEGAGETEITVTATVNGTTRYVDAKTVTVSVGGGTAISGTDYDAVSNFDIIIAAGDASNTGTFDLTPRQDDLHEGSETINLDGTLTGVTVTDAMITLTDDDGQPSFAVADASANEGDAITFTVTRSGAMDNAVSVKWNTKADTGAGAASTSDYTVMTTATKLDFAKGVSRQTFTVATTEDNLHEGNETFLVELTEPAGGTIDTAEATGTINDDDAEPTGITLTVSPATVGEGAGETEITVTATVNGTTRYVDAKTVTVSVGGGTAISGTDYDTVTNFDITIAAGDASNTGTFDLTPTQDDLHEGSETINVSGTSDSLTITPATVTINDDDAAPSGITLSVDTNGSTSGTPNTVAEGAGATVVTVTATVNGTTRYVDAKTVAVSVADNTAASPADYAAVSGFNITIAAGAASHTGSFTVTPVDDDLDESNETINVTGTLSSVTITGATVTLTDNDDPVSFSIADAEATEGGKVTFTVSRAGAGDNVASVKIATAADSGDGVNAASTSDYTAIATAQTLNFAKDITSQTVEVQTTQDDLFEPDETFKAVLSEPALADGDPGTGVSIESGKGTAIGTIKNDDFQPSFAVADASASEGDAITFTVTRSGAMDNAVSVKWNTKAATGAGAALNTDYTEMTTATKLDFAKGVGTQTFTVATTEDVLHEGNETFLVELTEPAGGTIATAEATGTINDDDAAPTGITLTVSPATVGEGAGETEITVTATVNGTTRYVDAKTVTVSVGGGTAISGTDYGAVANFDITIAAGDASNTGTFDLTPTQDDLHEGSETINVSGTSDSLTITPATVTINDDDGQPSFAVADASANEGDAITFTVTRSGAMDNAVSVKWNTKAATGAGAASTSDYTVMTTATKLDFAKGVGTQTFTVATTEDNLHEGNETFLVELTEPAGGTIDTAEATGTINDDDAEPTGITLTVSPATVGEGAGETEITVTATVNGTTRYVDAKTVTVSVGGGTAISGTDYDTVTNFDITIAAGDASNTGTFDLTPTQDDLHEGSETINVSGTSDSLTITPATVTINDDDAAPSGITLSVDTNGSTSGTPNTVAEGAGATVVTVTATVNGTTRYVDAKTVAVSVADNTAASPADYAAVSGFNITIAAGAASHTGSFTVTPVDDDLDESNETINVTGTLSSVTITGATVTLTDNDDPVSFSIADAEATEGGKVTFTVSRAGAGDNVASVKIATAADSGDGVNAASTSDYTAIATAQTLNFAKDITSQTVEVQTTQDDLFEPDETFKAVLSEPALADGDPGTGVSIESGKGTAIGTIKNDDFQPSFAVADASASEGDAITFTVTRSGAMDNAVSVKWNTKAATGAGAALNTDYTEMTTATKLDFAKGVGTQTFTVATTEDVLHEGNETFLVELTEPAGGTIATAEATGTINDDDAEPTGITLTVSPATVGEGAGETEITVTATVNGTTRYVDAKTVTVSVGGGTAISGTDYGAVANFDITIAAGDASNTGTFDLTPTQDDLHEGSETINVSGTSDSLTITPATVTINDDDGQPSFAVADASANEGDAITFTVTRSGAMDNAVSVKWNTKAATGAGAASTSDYTVMTTATKLDFAKGVGTQTFTVATTEDNLHEGNETFLVELTEPVGAIISDAAATGTINDDDAAPTALTLSVDADTGTNNVQTSLAEDGGAKMVRVTASLGGSSTFTEAKTVAVEVGADADGATEGMDYANVETKNITINAGASSGYVDFQLTPTNDDIDEPDEGISVEGTLASVTVTGTSLTITDDEGTPTVTLVLTPSTINESGDTNSSTVTATLSGKSSVAVTLTVAAAAGADTASGDFTVTANKTLTIAAGATTSNGAVTITAVDNDIDAPNKTVTVSATASGGGVANPGNQTLTITDNEGVPTATLVLTPSTINESGGTNSSTVTATLSGKSNTAVTLTVAAAAGADTASGDFTVTANKTLTIAAGATTSNGAVTITAVDNDIDAPNKTVTVSATASGGGVANPGNQTLIITDDEGTPTVTLVLTPSTINESGNGNASTVTATLSGESSAAVTVEVSVPNNAPVTVSGNTTLTIAAGSKASTGAVTITAVDNDVDGPNASVVVSGVASGGGVAVANPDNQTLTVTDDEGTPTVTLVLTPSTINESGGTNSSTVTATLSGKSNTAVTLTVAAAAGADTASGDFTVTANKTLTIAAGATTSNGAVTITAVDNDIDAPNKTVTVSATASGGGVANPGNQTLTITDDEGTPTVTLVLTPSTINESGNGNASTVTATLSGKSNTAVTLTVAATAGADTAASDFTVSNNKILTIAAGATTSTGAVTITAVDNDVDAPNKTVTVSATASGGGVANPGNQTLTITDDEGTPTVTLVLTPSTINESGNGNASTVTATLSGESSTAVTVEVSVPNNAPVTVTANKTLTIAEGATTSTGAVTITAVDNDVDAPNKTVTVSATASGGGVANPGNQTLTITDDEGTPTVTLVLTPSTINESGNGNASTVTATLSGESSTAVTVEVSVPNNAPVTVSGNTTLTIVAGSKASTGAVTITAVDNDIDAPNKTVTVSATASGGGVANPGNKTLTITDDEGIPTTTLVLTPTMIDESGATNASTVTATLSGKSNTAVTLTVAATAGADTAASDFTVSNNKTLTIAAGATTSTGAVTITAVDNNVDAPNKIVTVSATASGGGVADPTNQTLTIKDDDDVPSSITLSVSPATVGEAGGAKMVRVTVTLVGSTFTEAKTVTVDVGADADSAEKGTDYTTVEQQSIKINAGAASGYVEFKLTPTDDTLHEGSETISLEGTLADETLADVTVTDATITLTDDDATPSGITLSVSPATVGEGDGKTEITVTASVNGTTRYTNAKTVTVSVGGGSATSGTDYKAVSNFDITIPAGDASKTGTFDLTPTQDELHEGSETINLDGTLTGVTVTDAMITLTDDDGQPSFAVADASANEGDAIAFTVTRSGAMDNAVSVKWNTKAATGGGAASTSDYTAMTTATKLDFAKGVGTQTFTVATTEDNLHEGNETFLVELTEPVGAIISDAAATGTITDDDVMPSTLTLSVDTDMGTNNVQTSLAEDGGANMVRVTATLGDSSTFNVAQTVTVEVGADTDSATEGMDYKNVGTQNITINAGESSGYVEFPLTPTDDDIDEPDEGISIEGTLASVTVTGTSLTIMDDEGTPTVTLVLTPTTINENGATNTSTVTATLSGESSAAVTVEVSVPNTAPVTLSSNTTLTIAAGAKASTGTVTITAVDNNVDAPNKTVTISATASGGEVANPVNQTLTINDDDVAPTGITLSVSPTTVGEEDGETEITVTATVKGSTRYADAKTVTVSVGGGTAISGTDYHAVSNFDIIIAAAGASKTGTFNLTPINDALQEEDETIEVSGSSGALDITKATITITNSGSLPAAWLGRFGRAVAEQTLDGIAGRIAASRNPGVQGSIAGHGLNFNSPSSGSETLPRFDPRGGTGISSTTNNTTTLSNLVNNDTLERSELTLMSGYGGTDVFDSDGTTSQSHTMTARELLLGSSFTATGEKDVSGGSLASWGRTAQSSFDGREGTLSLDGETTTTMLGVDYARDHWLVGMALMRSNGKGGYRDSETKLRAASSACSITENGTEQDTCNSAVRNGEGDGEIEATLTAVVPYAAIQTSEQLKLWGTLGHGTGEVTLMSVVGDPLKANISWTMAAVGLRSDIIVPQKNSTELGPLSGSGLALAFTADALWARTDSDRTDDLLASNSDVTRLRFGLEGSYPIALQKGGSITPRLEMSVRHDGGTAETGLGLELIGGLTWLDPTLGLSIDLSGRTLLIHSSDDLKNQSVAVEFAWDSDPATRRGPALTFSQQWGTKALGGLDTPFGPDSIEDLGDSGNTAGWQAEASWGFPIFGGSFTGSPHVGVGLASDTRDYSLGWRLMPAVKANAPDLSLAVKATRQESDTAPPKHSIGFELIFRW